MSAVLPKLINHVNGISLPKDMFDWDWISNEQATALYKLTIQIDWNGSKN